MFSCQNQPRVLVLASHPDDDVIGAGGFLYRLVQETGATVKIVILTPGLRHWVRGRRFAHGVRVREAKEAAEALGIGSTNVDVFGFRDCDLHLHLHEMIEQIEILLENDYDILLTHVRGDTHSDHRAAHDATVSAARYFRGTVLLYQAPSTVPNQFRPTHFVHLDPAVIEAKQRALDCHSSQRGKAFMGRNWTQDMARAWAVFLRCPGEFFEAFEVYKSCWWSNVTAETA